MANLIHDELINGLGEEVVGDDGAEGVAYEGEIVSRRLYLAREMMVPKEWPTKARSYLGDCISPGR